MKAVIVAVVATAACSAGACFFALRAPTGAGLSTLDGSTEESFRVSVDAARATLTKRRQEQFEDAMVELAVAAAAPADNSDLTPFMMATSADPGGAARRLRTRVHGMSADEVIAAGATVAADKARRGATRPTAGGGMDLLAALSSAELNTRESAAIAMLLALSSVQQPRHEPRMHDPSPLGALFSARLNANESAAIATLKNISSAQSQCQASGVIDVNNNGAGEYGFFGELSGRSAVRGSTLRISPPVLSTAFGQVTQSRIVRSGYVFQMFLPDSKSMGIAEAESGGGDGLAVDPAQAESLWCCYAWPQEPGQSGRRAFFINQCGDVLACTNANQQYSGTKAPLFTAAFAGRTAQGLGDAIAANATGIDGESWVVVN